MARPLVVGTLTGEGSLPSQIKKAKSPFVDIVEVRLDTFPWIHAPFSVSTPKSQNLLTHIRKATKKPLLLTLRSFTECGKAVPEKFRLSDEQRMTILARLLSSCDMIDVEIRRWPFAKVATALAHRHDLSVIHSYHQFSGRFRATDAAKWAKKSNQIKGDIVKIAITPKTNEDLEDFLTWGMALNNPARILIGMGKVGLPSRLLGFSFGSVMTYGHLGRSAAPGQWPADVLGKTVQKLYAHAQ